ncbi:hypothetical protein WME99_07155 [Sorangium sp. So ce136]|uniref:hypothetical protein n=1 Tax=Sorangium sp. So ce136 TaxID=3133284 RepID=UPI003EFF3B91
MPTARRASVRRLDLDLLSTSPSSPSSSSSSPRAGPPPVDALVRHFALEIPRVFSEAERAALVAGVRAARAEWTADFGGEQFSLGRAFYTHLEQGRSKVYFADAAASDARVERHLPGLQRRMRELVAALTGGLTQPRRGFCGPGVHIFPAGEKVAREGGVVHFDTEGLSDYHLARRLRAITIVVMLELPDADGGLKLWDVLYDGRDDPGDEALSARSLVAGYSPGGALVIDSYRLHQIQPFPGGRDRISATVHAAEIDSGRWETWF